MRSRAQFKAHPIHPALIPFPFAFLIGATLFDLLGMATDKPEWSLTGGHLTVAGLAAGLLAAIPGAIDFIYTVPPASSGKKRAAQHAIGNVTALALFAAAFAARSADWQPGALTIGLELLGAGVLGYAGWLGGTLVTRNLISRRPPICTDGQVAGSPIDASRSRSADRGSCRRPKRKPDEAASRQWHSASCSLGRRTAIARSTTRCTHRGGSLAAGVLIDGTVQCLWHGSQFDVSDGAVSCGPAKKRIAVYGIEEKPNGQLVLVSPPE